MHGGSAEVVNFRAGGERRGGGVGADAKENIVVRVDVFLEGENPTVGAVGFVVQVQVAAFGHSVAEQLAAGKPKTIHDAAMETLVEVLVPHFLDAVSVSFQKAPVFDVRWVFEVDKDSDFLALRRLEDGLE